jgi:hypothetical protein
MEIIQQLLSVMHKTKAAFEPRARKCREVVQEECRFRWGSSGELEEGCRHDTKTG